VITRKRLLRPSTWEVQQTWRGLSPAGGVTISVIAASNRNGGPGQMRRRNFISQISQLR
jgi:hypothetical protein